MSYRSVLSQLVELSKLSAPSPATFNDVLHLTLTAFEQKKPLFEAVEVKSAVVALSKSLPLFEHAYRQLSCGMNVDRRQEAQMSRSGLQYIADELEDVPDLHEKLEELMASAFIRHIEKYIENTVGVPPENVPLTPIDLNKIPKTHYWWFHPEDDDSEQ